VVELGLSFLNTLEVFRSFKTWFGSHSWLFLKWTLQYKLYYYALFY